ncbi:MAG: hypothetical protein AAF941_06265 [Pseudomonadota bacterium]
MPQKRRRSPAEKKALSYEKDRRRDYWGNNKGGRKSVPRNKAESRRADRRKASAKLTRYQRLDETAAGLVENELAKDIGRSKRFQKSPGVILRASICAAHKKRDFLVGRKQWSKKKRKEAEENGAQGYGISWRGSEIASIFERY